MEEYKTEACMKPPGTPPVSHGDLCILHQLLSLEQALN